MVQTTETTSSTLFQELDTTPQIREPKKVLDRDDFMLLFIKQLEYQDPLKPLENNEMATQLALFNQLDELYSLNQKLDSLISIMENSNFNLYSSIIGKTVEIEGNVGRIEGGTFMGARLILDEPTQHVIIKIADESGNIVRTMDMGSLAAGEHQIEWDGTDDQGNPLPDGNYRLIIETEDGEYSGQLLVKGKITSVSLSDQENTLYFNDLTPISLDEIREIYESQTNEADNLQESEEA